MRPGTKPQTWSPHIKTQPLQHAQARPDAFAINRGAFWFDDGNIILEVEGVHFRVYTGMLALHSPSFRDLPHYLPIDATASERRIDGHPIVVLSDVPRDWEIVLSVIFDPNGQRRL